MSTGSSTQDLPGLGEALLGAFLRTQRALALVRADGEGCGHIVKANRALAELIGRDPDLLCGTDLLDVLGCGRLAEVCALVRSVVDGEVPSADLQTRLVRPDGREISLELDLVGVDGYPLAERWVLVGARDVTAEVRAIATRRLREVITGVLATAASVQGATSALLPALGDSLGFSLGAVWSVDEQVDELRCCAVWQADASTDSYAGVCRESRLRRGDSELPGRVWETGKPAWSADLVAQGGHRARAARNDGLHSAIAFPLYVGPELNAIVEFAATTQREITGSLLWLLDEMGTEIAALLARKQLQERRPDTTLLLVEDNMFIARLVGTMLATHDSALELVHVERLSDALASLATSRPACVLLDLTLPDASGLQALLDVRGAAPDVPVVVLTGTDDKELAVRAVQAGAQDYLVKRAVNPEGLGRAIRYAIERKSVEHQLREHELTDRLTGLPNRVLFTDRVSVALARSTRGSVGVLLVNLDRFRLLNDSLGHAWGDRLLRAAAERVSRTAPTEASVASFGGDEFAVLLDNATAEDVLRAAGELAEAVSAPYELDGEEIHITATVGVATNLGGGCTAEGLIAQADTALSRGKEFDGSRYEVFDETLRDEMRARLALQTGLRTAILKRQLSLYYQPLVSLADRRVVGYEALVRWNHPERGVVCPSEFLPLAEESSLIVAIGRWALGEALGQLADWDAERDEGPPLVMHVNLSARELAEPDLVDIVAAALRNLGLAPSRLCLEVTETGLIDDLERSARTLTALRALGVSVAIDDFGTGYSSLSYLERFPVTVLKLDRSFVSSSASEGRQAIVMAVANIAKALGIEVVAEGIETEEQFEQLRAVGYTTGQGWLLGYPRPAEHAPWHGLPATSGSSS